LRLFEPLFKYQNYALTEKSELGAEVDQTNNIEGRRPLWLAVLEVEEKNLNYSLLAAEGSEATYELENPRNLFQAHRMYDNVEEERDLIDLSHLYTEGVYEEENIRGLYLPAMIAVMEDSANSECSDVDAYETWKRRCTEIGLEFNFIGIKKCFVNEIDKKVWKHIGRFEKSESGIRKLIKRVRRIILEKEKNNNYDIEDYVLFEAGEWGHEWFEDVWNEKRNGVILYFIWLRCLALSAERESVSDLREASNFKTYLYFPVPDISGDYVHTITAAFTDWPDPEWVQMVQQQAPKLFQRSGLRLAQRQAHSFGHEVYDTMEWVVRGLRREGELWDSIPVLLRQGLITVRLSMRRITGFDYNSTAEFPGLGDNPIEDYLTFSTMVALQRLGRITDKGLRRKARHLRLRMSASEILDFINLEVRQESPQNIEIIRSEKFGTLFYRCLWQSIYHSIIYKYTNEDDSRKTKISIESDNDSVSVEIANPGSGRSKETKKIPKDKSEIRELGNYLGANRVYGPRYSEINDCWITGFTFARNDK
jgi:hypothetical protein